MSPAPPSRKLAVLLVDDYPDTVDSLALILRAEGHDVRTATGGAEAVGLLDGWQPDAAILDLHMSGMDGIELAGCLRSGLARRPLLVAVSGSIRGHDWDRLKTAGFDHQFLKPVDPRELEEVLKNHAGRVLSGQGG